MTGRARSRCHPHPPQVSSIQQRHSGAAMMYLSGTDTAVAAERVCLARPIHVVEIDDVPSEPSIEIDVGRANPNRARYSADAPSVSAISNVAVSSADGSVTSGTNTHSCAEFTVDGVIF